MSLKTLLAATAVSALALMAASSASATVDQLTFTGSAFGFDGAQIFTDGSFIGGDEFVAVYDVDNTKGNLVLDIPANSQYGGYKTGYSDPVVFASLTIDGTKYDVNTSSPKNVSDLTGVVSFPWLLVGVSTHTGSTELSNGAALDVLGLQGAVTGEGSFTRSNKLGSTDLNLLTDSFTQTVLPGAPEPSTWAMMIVGVGLIGAGLRSARHTGLAPA